MVIKREKAIALCRVSTKGQLLDGNLDPQIESVNKAARLLDLDLVKVWALAVSSRKGKNMKRKDLWEMLDYCKRYRSVKYLVIDEVDRFMRSIDEYYWWKMEFKKLGVRLVHANRPDIDPDDDRAVFDELIDIYRAQQSNEERMRKTPEKMMAKIRAGYYPSNPHTGYKISDIPGLHVPDEPNWSALRNAFKAMIAGECDISEGLKRATQDGLRTKNYGPKAVGGRKVDMYRWKDLMTDDYYSGTVKLADWPEVNPNGLHQPMITPEEHEILVAIVKNKGKRFIVNRNNPEYIMTNDVDCTECLASEVRYPRFVGYWQNNGKAKGYKKYRRYRCRGCNMGLRQENLHAQITEVLGRLTLTPEQREKLKKHMRKVWADYETERIERARIALGKAQILKDKKSNAMDSYMAEKDPKMKQDIREKVELLNTEIAEAEKAAAEAQNFERDFSEFIDFAFDLMDNLDTEWWKQDKATMRLYKHILFPAGIQLTQEKNVYIPQISVIYSFENEKQPPKGGCSD